MGDADREAQRIADEAADHVRQEQAELTKDAPACDFCAKSCPDLSVTTTFELDGAIIGGASFITEDLGAATMPIGYDPLWLACDECAPVVKMNNPVALVEHVMNSRHGALGQIPATFRKEIAPAVRADLLSLYQAFYEGHPRIVPC